MIKITIMGFLGKFFNKEKEEDKESTVNETATVDADLTSKQLVEEKTADEIDLPGEKEVAGSDINEDNDIDINV